MLPSRSCSTAALRMSWPPVVWCVSPTAYTIVITLSGRPVSPTIFEDDPLRLLRAVRLEDELGLALDAETEALLRRSTALVTRAAGERILAELRRLSPSGFRRLAEVGLLAELGGTVDERLERLDDPDFRLVAVLGAKLAALPISNDLRRYANVLLRAQPPEDASPRSIHRFRRRTEPWALDALAFVGTSQLAPLVEAARRADPAEPLVRGDELGLRPGPEIGRILAVIDEERAAGTISTREEALDLARALASEEATRDVARALAGRLRDGDVVSLEGPLGAGKTLFAQALAAELGVVGPVTSPTYALVNRYARADGGAFVHVDLYRLGDESRQGMTSERC